MELTSLNAISPIDGRYRRVTEVLSAYFSESALMKYRVMVEVEYFIALCELPLPQLKSVDKSSFSVMRDIHLNFTEEDAQVIKDIEKKTNHDIKAVEYFVREQFSKLGLDESVSFIHFGLTSQDVNNTAIPKLLMDSLNDIYYPIVNELVKELCSLSGQWEDVAMLARTHGQPASPTRMGKEIKVFVERLQVQLDQLSKVPHSAKFGGATGNFNAHHVAYPHIDWVAFANKFVDENLGLTRSQTTTQIEHYDNLAAICDNLKRINNIIIDLDRDMWTYISMDYFGQKIVEGETGSSAMPHKVNPIDFENSEGNAGMANATFEHFSSKLPISRLQRDLTDSTVLRNLGVPIGHTLIAFKSLLKGLGKLILNEDVIRNDLNNHPAVVAEAIQTILRREGVSDAYEKLKDLTRSGQGLNGIIYNEFITQLDISEEVKEELRAISPGNYTGI
ncbi:MAG TPA: adenylosuccinate lyase [Flavobacteriales bacterium]|nr:adenylosuccinate lyase [Flavobacteriales bacterium]HIA11048.1 adenylosuccinate lyase [Flavobacteriales bacterium]HIO71735.1 adenylosuccinate lyase [Flavobacteriales bacterium]